MFLVVFWFFVVFLFLLSLRGGFVTDTEEREFVLFLFLLLCSVVVFLIFSKTNTNFVYFSFLPRRRAGWRLNTKLTKYFFCFFVRFFVFFLVLFKKGKQTKKKKRKIKKQRIIIFFFWYVFFFWITKKYIF